MINRSIATFLIISAVVTLVLIGGCTLQPPQPESPLPTPTLEINVAQDDTGEIPPIRMIDSGEQKFAALGNEIITAEGQEFAIYWTYQNINVPPLILMSGGTPVIGEYVFNLELRNIQGGDPLTKTMIVNFAAQADPGEGLAVNTYTTWANVPSGDYELWKKVVLVLRGQDITIVNPDTGEAVPVADGYEVDTVILDNAGNIAELDANGFAFDSIVNVPFQYYLPVIFK